MLEKIEYTIISYTPPEFTLNCVTSGGPVANTFWTLNGTRTDDSEIYRTEVAVVNYTAAVYYHTLFVTADAPGIYKFLVEDPFAAPSENAFKSVSHVVESKFKDITTATTVCTFAQLFYLTWTVVMTPAMRDTNLIVKKEHVLVSLHTDK